MEKLNIAIFGADGGIGKALCLKYLEDIRVKNIFTIQLYFNGQLFNQYYQGENNTNMSNQDL